MTATFDMVIRGGTIVDGTGSASFAGDVAIQDGLIAAVGSVHGIGREEIDAQGKVVTPGFVDVHTHYDGQITWENRLVPSSNHGVTTVVMGNCGVGFAPVRKTDHEMVIRLMEGVEDIPDVVMAEGVPWNWESFPDYLDALERRQADLDFATQLPHSPLRVFVMGERGANLEPPTAEDLATMRRLVREAVEAGALGVSSSRNLFHRFRTGAFAPSVRTEMDELLALAGGLKDAGQGVFQCNPNLNEDARDEFAIFRRVHEYSGRPVNFSLISTAFLPENWGYYVDLLRAAADEGLPMRGQFMPRPIGVMFGLDLSFHPFSLNPSYRPIAQLPLAEKVARMRDPELRARLIAEEPDDPNPAFIGLLQTARKLFVVRDPANYHPAVEDIISEKARILGLPEKEVIYDELLKDDGHAILCAFSSDIDSYLAKTAELFSLPNAIIGLGDGGAHYGMICDAAYTTYVLTQRVGKFGLDLPTAVRALSSKTAQSVGLNDRGMIGEGYKADINVIDLERLTLRRPNVRADLPAGGKRLAQRSEGYMATIVSGVVTIRNDEPTGALPGRLVRGSRSAPQSGHAQLAA
jgi:N-acyl-D-aspartate/D-glutamate deacylase